VRPRALALLALAGCAETSAPPPRDASPDDADVAPLDVADVPPPDVPSPDAPPPDVADVAAPDAPADGDPCGGGSPCAEGRVCCGGRCVDPSSNAAHCGACDVACAAPPRAAAACEAGVCRVRCDVGYADCNSDRADGCEVELATSARDCGRCGNDCGSGACEAGRCAAADCVSPQRGDCDGDRANGCEADLAADPAHCGACGRACEAATVCAGGACGVPLTRSCAVLHRVAPTLPTGVYTIDADALGPRAPFAVYCDMEADGGGWTYGAVVRTTTDAMGGARLLGVTPFGAPTARWMDGEHAVDLTGLSFREVRIDDFTDRRSVVRAAATTLVWDAGTYPSAGGAPAKRVALEGDVELRLGVAGASGCDASRVNLPVCFVPAGVPAASVCDAGAAAFEGWAGAAASGRCGMPACAVLFRDASCASYASRVAVYGFALR